MDTFDQVPPTFTVGMPVEILDIAGHAIDVTTVTAIEAGIVTTKCGGHWTAEGKCYSDRKAWPFPTIRPSVTKLFEANPELLEVFNDRTSSTWLKSAIVSAMQRDPVDAANDAEILAKVLDENCKLVLKLAQSGGRQPSQNGG